MFVYSSADDAAADRFADDQQGEPEFEHDEFLAAVRHQADVSELIDAGPCLDPTCEKPHTCWLPICDEFGCNGHAYTLGPDGGVFCAEHGRKAGAR